MVLPLFTLLRFNQGCWITSQIRASVERVSLHDMCEAGFACLPQIHVDNWQWGLCFDCFTTEKGEEERIKGEEAEVSCCTEIKADTSS